jgi:membrane-bound ClpP family serine protease
MKPQTLIGIILIVVAVAAFGYQGISYTSREKVIDLGPLQMTAEKTNTIPLPPIVGAVALIGGLVLLVSGSRKS